jgi:DNA-binding NarL/FixJ family response regulator
MQNHVVAPELMLVRKEIKESPIDFRGNYRCTLIVLDPRPLTREALVRLLQSVGPFRVIPVAEVGQLAALTTPESVVHAAIINLGSEAIDSKRGRSYIPAVQNVLPSVPLIIISDHEDRSNVCKALRLNVRGYVSTNLTSQMLLAALRVVEAGGTFVPASAVAEAAFHSATPTKPHVSPATQVSPAIPEKNANGADGLTKRERQVLSLLQKGKPNKLIAFELSMGESTVKVHVRQIMRKLKVTNRTQAALAAASSANGYCADPVTPFPSKWETGKISAGGCRIPCPG